MAEQSDNRRLIGNMQRLGTIASVDLAQGTVRVAVGDLLTGDLPWITGRAGGTRLWSPPSVGEQVLLLCPEGDDDSGIVLPGVYSDANPAPADDDAPAIHFADGAVIRYDPAAHQLSATLPDGGIAQITAPGGIKLVGDVEITGKVHVTGDVTGDADIKAGSISLKSHKHGQVQAGGAQSGAPVA